MSGPAADASGAEADALLAAELLAVDPAGLGGAALRGPPGPLRSHWLDQLRAAAPPATAFRRLPLHITDERLLGGLDLAVTLRTGRRAVQRGLLAESDGGWVVAAMAERLSDATAARIATVMDQQEVVLERDGLAARFPARFALVALDEGLDAEETAPSALLERLAFHLDLANLDPRARPEAAYGVAAVAAARDRLSAVRVPEDVVEALVTTAAALGVHSARAAWFAVRAARAIAALRGEAAVGAEDAAAAARLVLAPRATQMPATAEDDTPESPEPPEGDEPPPDTEPETDETRTPPTPEELQDVVLAAARAAIPEGLLLRLEHLARAARGSRSQGRAGAKRAAVTRGRPIGTRSGAPERGARLSLVDTLRAAAPWQPVRRRAAQQRGGSHAGRIHLEQADFRIRRFKERSETTTIFVVDASGSSALHRLAEAKGAVELLLADCYVRRDRVAVVAFRGTLAEVLLPPTRSLVRAKRSLAGLPGGGGTPLASGIDAALTLAAGIARRGGTPTIVLLTDGRANIARDAAPGRARAEADALAAARSVRAARVTALLIDTAPRPHPLAAQLAAEMHARYVPLPHADAAAVNRAVRTVVERDP